MDKPIDQCPPPSIVQLNAPRYEDRVNEFSEQLYCLLDKYGELYDYDMIAILQIASTQLQMTHIEFDEE